MLTDQEGLCTPQNQRAVECTYVRVLQSTQDVPNLCYLFAEEVLLHMWPMIFMSARMIRYVHVLGSVIYSCVPITA